MSNHSYQLLVRRGPQEGQTFPLTGEVLTIGRDPMSDITLTDPEVSRQHARLTRTSDDTYEIQDLGSTNGTFVDGNRLGGDKVRLSPGQIVVVGSNVTLVFESIADPMATVVSAREDLIFDEPQDEPEAEAEIYVPAEPEPIEPEPMASEPIESEPMEMGATDKLEPDVAEHDATIVDESYAPKPSYPVFGTEEPQAPPPPEPEPLPAYDEGSQTVVDTGEPFPRPGKETPSYRAESVTPPPPPPPSETRTEPEGNRNRNLIIVVVVLLLLCCCCGLLAVAWYFGDTIFDLFDSAFVLSIFSLLNFIG